jgi:hypothetical protein
MGATTTDTRTGQMRSRPQEPPHDATSELLEWALTLLLVAVAMGGMWAVAELVR